VGRALWDIGIAQWVEQYGIVGELSEESIIRVKCGQLTKGLPFLL